MTTKRREYTREFKLEAVSLVVDHKRKIAEVAESLGVGASTLDNWVRKYKKSSKGLRQLKVWHSPMNNESYRLFANKLSN